MSDDPKTVEEWRAIERQTSEAYIRLRAMIPGAFKTPYAPSAEQIWATTENALARLIKSHDDLQKQHQALWSHIRKFNQELPL